MRGSAYLVVTCDGCDYEMEVMLEDIPFTETYTAEGLDELLKDAGWEVWQGRDFCPDCEAE